MDLCLKDIGLAIKAAGQHKNRKQRLSPAFQISLASQKIRELMSERLGKVLWAEKHFYESIYFKAYLQE